MSIRIVVIGATGHFGGRICRRLLDQPDLVLVPASRNLASAQTLAGELQTVNPGATIEAACLDQFATTFAGDLRQLHPDIVIHTAGPYQNQQYTVAEACLACGCHYLDIADGRQFVAGFGTLDAAARKAGLLLVSGASTLPGLSSAVIDKLRPEFQTIDSIEISIAPAHQTPRGRSTVAAVLSYCGRPFGVRHAGRAATVYGWQDMRVIRYPDLGTRLAGACDVPDLELLGPYAGGVSTVQFHAALEAKWEQLSLWLMSGLTRLRLVRSWHRLVPVFQWFSDRLIRFGSDVGGMHLRVSGTGANGDTKVLTWYLTARQNHGPEIPCAPALVLARKLAAGELPATGAMPCLGLISLREFDAEVSDLDIDWTIVDER